jgi:hypothetical protein
VSSRARLLGSNRRPYPERLQNAADEVEGIAVRVRATPEQAAFDNNVSASAVRAELTRRGSRPAPEIRGAVFSGKGAALLLRDTAMPYISGREAANILRHQPGARLVLTGTEFWIIPGGRVTRELAWRLIQRLEVADNGLLGNCPQSWRDPRNKRAPDGRVWAQTLKEIRAMDIREFLGPPKFIKHGDHQDGPRRAIIESVAPNKKYDNKLDATLQYVDGGRGVLSLNVTNLTALSKAAAAAKPAKSPSSKPARRDHPARSTMRSRNPERR